MDPIIFPSKLNRCKISQGFILYPLGQLTHKLFQASFRYFQQNIFPSTFWTTWQSKYTLSLVDVEYFKDAYCI